VRQAFLDFLATDGGLSPRTIDSVRELLRSPPEPIGSIAFSYGMVTGADIDLILADQRRTHRRFGEIAMAMGMLTKAQVETLVRVQQVRAATETAEALVLSGAASIDDMATLLGRFLMRASSGVAATSEAR